MTRLTRDDALVVGAALLLTAAWAAWAILRFGSVFSTLDGVSHLYIARVVIDNGSRLRIDNLGTVWLPGFHVAVMPLVAINELYRTGLAGTIVNGLALAGSAVVLRRLVGGLPGLVAALLLVVNPFVLVYATSPMTEMPAIFLLLLGVFLLEQYRRTPSPGRAVGSALALAAGTLVRYELWPVAVAASVLFIIYARPGTRSRAVAPALLCWVGIAFWLVWNAFLHHTPIAFLTHPGAREIYSGLWYQGSWWRSFRHLMAGLRFEAGLLWIPALAGLVILAVRRPGRLVAVLLLFVPVLAHVPLGALGRSLGLVRFYLLGLPALLVLAFVPAREWFSERRLLAMVWSALVVATVAWAVPGFVALVRTGTDARSGMAVHTDIDYPLTAHWYRIGAALGREAGDSLLLCTVKQERQLISVALGRSPARIVDAYDCPGYQLTSVEPWTRYPYVLVDTLRPSDRTWNEYFGAYYGYRIHTDPGWRAEFLQHYQPCLALEDVTLYRRYRP